MITRALPYLVMLVLAGALTACSGSGLRTVRCTLGDASLTVELAETDVQKSRGLMYRQKLGKNRGMLFPYDSQEVRTFWMKNTYVPLSIAFIDDNKKIVHIADMQPRDLDSTSSIRPCQYVLEVNKGWFDEHRIDVGDPVEFEIPDP